VDELSRAWAFVGGLAAGWALAALTIAVPRAVRSLHNWTSAALFSSFSKRGRRLALALGSASALWLLVLAGTVYAPVSALAPEVLPLPGGLKDSILALNSWLIAASVPLVVGLVQASTERGGGARRFARIPQAFVHVPALAAALAVLAPWIAWSRLAHLVSRHQTEQHHASIDPEQYDSVVDALRASLESAGLETTVAPPPLPIVWSRALLDGYGPPVLRSPVAYSPRQIHGHGYRVLIFDGLLEIASSGASSGRVRRAIIGKLPPAGLWWTRSESARALEMMIRVGGSSLDEVPARIEELDVGLEEWRALNRAYLQAMALRTQRTPGGAVT